MAMFPVFRFGMVRNGWFFVERQESKRLLPDARGVLGLVRMGLRVPCDGTLFAYFSFFLWHGFPLYKVGHDLRG